MAIRRMILLVAGMGKRLQPLTQDLPKCMVPLHGSALLEWQMAAARQAGLSDFVLVGGYRADRLAADSAKVIINPAYETTNMVESLWCAREFLDQDVVVSYGDIVCAPEVLAKAARAGHDISVAVDTSWRAYWERRFDNPLRDAESLSLEDDGRIRSIGQKVQRIEEIEAQFIGLISLSRAGAKSLMDWYSARRNPEAPGGGLTRMFMTDLLQAAIHDSVAVHGLPIEGGWLEVDTLSDHRLAEKLSAPKGRALEVLR